MPVFVNPRLNLSGTADIINAMNDDICIYLTALLIECVAVRVLLYMKIEEKHR